ncbi:MAG: NUDIX hydrolase [candidate division WOR-3 bacterium]|uniref:NUDIX hydrolase n=1 Tax=candidate division WOR-3 bacterium TaxID=2052148 RepID=A0A7C1NBL1_UNCW3|nr:NUDIX hydrolase [candidate division WOR-3 bacterium]
MRYRQPKLAVDCIIRLRDRVVLIYRRNEPKGWALPGGFVNYGETVEEAVVREIREETGLELDNLQQFHVYSDPKRDPRWHCVSVVFTAEGRGEPRAGDDAGRIMLVELDRLDEVNLVFDHRQILEDYRGQCGANPDRR